MYPVKVFEYAAIAKSCVVHRITQNENGVKTMYGKAFMKGKSRHVRWNKKGQCFGHFNTPIQELNLPLAEVKERLKASAL